MNDHPLTKAGLGCVVTVEEAGPGLRLGDIVFEFPFGRIVDTGIACKRNGIIPRGVDIMDVHMGAAAITAAFRAATPGSAARECSTFQAGQLPAQ